MRSRTMWKHPLCEDWWQRAYKNTPGIERLLKNFPGISIYGKVYGQGIQELEYGVKEPHFVAFDIWEQGKGWMFQDHALFLLEAYGIPTVEILYGGKYQGFDHILSILETFKDSWLARRNGKSQISEGIVVQSLETRKILKLKSDYYLEGVK